MDHYLAFRIRVYHQSLSQWLDSLRQISMGLVALFPLALPALLLIPLLALGVLADSASHNTVYLNTLWGYLLLTYSWVALQRDGIQATRYRLYLDSLPISQSKRNWCELGLILYGANVFILGPLLLAILMLVSQAQQVMILSLSELVHSLLPISGLLFLASYYSLSAVQGTRPWLSLLLLPLLATPWAELWSKTHWLLLWAVAIVVERHLVIPTVRIGRRPAGFYRILLQADIDRPRNEGLRLVALLLLVILAGIFSAGVKAEVRPYVANLASFISAVLIASSLFDAQAVRRRYQLYLASLPHSLYVQQLHSVVYVVIKAIPAMLVLAYLQLFNGQQWGLWSLFYISSLVGIVTRPKWFLFFPLSVAVLLFVTSLYVA